MLASCPVHRHAQTAPHRVALQSQGRQWTYAQLDAWTAQLAGTLEHRGLGPGTRLAVLSNNRPELIPLLFACWRLGGAVVMLNARLTAAELAAQLSVVRPALTLAETALKPRLPDAVALETLEASPAVATAGQPLASERAAAILFTSGTTGRPKAAVLTWANLEAAANASAANIGGAPTDAWLLCLPIFHIGGLSMVVRAASYGARLVLHERFDAAAVSSSFDADGITHASLVTVGLQRLLTQRAGREFSPDVRAVLIGGGPVPATLLSQARQLKLPVLQTYGLTEACAQVTTERPGQADGETAGHPLRGFELRIVDGEGAAMGTGEIGEIEVRGPTVMAGYFGDESETHQTLWKGWLRTRDLGALDAQGRLRVFSRRTDLIISGGENVYPAEIEAALLALPGVREAAVLGVDDPRWGQVPIAAVAADAGVTDEQLTAHLRARLAGYKVPRSFVRVEELPRNAMGKVDRAAVRALLLDAQAKLLPSIRPPDSRPT